MPRLKSTAALVLLLSFASLAEAEPETRRSYSATAFALEGGEELYVETHIETWRNGRLAERQVRYEDPVGRPIAEKIVRYGDSAEAPSFEMVDFRNGVREGARVRPSEVILYSGPSEVPAEQRARSVERPLRAVVDAGFDAFMRDNFESIAAGRPLEFEFAVPAVRRFFRFQLSAQGEILYGDEPALLVVMKPASTILRLLVDPIELIYSRQGRLLEFRGLANVSDESGERYEARIVFDYPTLSERTPRLGAAP